MSNDVGAVIDGLANAISTVLRNRNSTARKEQATRIIELRDKLIRIRQKKVVPGLRDEDVLLLNELQPMDVLRAREILTELAALTKRLAQYNPPARKRT